METTLVQPRALNVRTFSNSTSGGSALFKALGHPLTAQKMKDFIATLSNFKTVAIYDPLGYSSELQCLYDLSGIKGVDVFVQNVADIDKVIFGQPAKPVNTIKNKIFDALLVVAFDAGRLIAQIEHLLSPQIKIFSLDNVRLEDEFLTNTRHYLDNLNFATNFVFFRDQAGHHTRLVTANYWAGYNAKNTGLWCCLFDGQGKVLAQWKDHLQPSVHTITIDSRQVRERFGLAEFTGSLFVHFTQVAGHDIVKYVQDTYGDEFSVLSCTHDANSWPADFYAGLPAPREGEKVVLWIQNSHPCSIPINGIGISLMGSDDIVPFDKLIAPFATQAVDVTSLLPQVRWPQQLEVHAGRYCIRPRYEIIKENGRRWIAHTNVERNDLKVDPKIPEISQTMGKGYILPAPILPPGRWRNTVLPTPMSRCQQNLPLALLIFDSQGQQLGRYSLGKLDRSNIKSIEINKLLSAEAGKISSDDFGHLELVYDFSQGGGADGWLHAIFRYEDTQSGHTAETSFGSHIFNTVLVFNNEPQSYAGKPPGLSTRLFLRLGSDEKTDSLCHLIYPASTPWHSQSQTDLILCDAKGTEVLKKTVHIPCSGSLLWRYHKMFSKQERDRAGKNAYLMIRDITCRLFGYQGLMRDGVAFSLDHMFGF